MTQLEQIFKPILQSIMFLLFLFLIIFFNLANKYYQNSFTISLNNQELYIYYKEDYKRMLIPLLLDARNHVKSGNYVSPKINELELSDKYILNIKEYSLYNKNGIKQTSSNDWSINPDYINIKEEELNKTTLIIKRTNNILYEGIYISDITEYIKEPGRYYFQFKSIRTKDNATIKTHMSFNVIIGGGNHD